MTLREIEPEELEETQRLHVQWLESDGKAGRRADLRNVILKEQPNGDFRKADFRGSCICGKEPPLRMEPNESARVINDTPGVNFAGANLSGITWIGASLRGANLTLTNFDGANLSRSDFSGADVTDANLNNASLRDANLENAHGLLSRMLRGADLGNAKLPKPIETFEGLKIVDAFSQNAAKVFILLLVGCAYAWLTIATTTDASLITNAGNSKWPIIQTEVPIVWFFLCAPIVLFCIYIYLHLYLQRLWESLADLPAIFPDGYSLDRRTYPWLMNDLVRDDFALLRRNQPALAWIQQRISILLCWWLMPITLLVFWARYVPRHDFYGTAFHVMLFALTVWAGVLFYSLARATLRGNRGSISVREHLRRNMGPRIAFTAFAVLGAISYGAIRGECHYNPLGIPLFDRPNRHSFVGRLLPSKSSVPKFLDFVRRNAFADLTLSDLSVKPASWTGLDTRGSEELLQVKGAQLQHCDLRYATGKGAFLANAAADEAQFTGAYLERANFYNARLSNTNFSNARLSYTDLRKAYLFRSKLKKAILEGADLRDANLSFANLRGADLSNVNAQRAIMNSTDFAGANLEGAQLEGAYLFGSNITKAQVARAKIGPDTKLPLFSPDTVQRQPILDKFSSANRSSLTIGCLGLIQ